MKNDFRGLFMTEGDITYVPHQNWWSDTLKERFEQSCFLAHLDDDLGVGGDLVGGLDGLVHQLARGEHLNRQKYVSERSFSMLTKSVIK